MSFDANIVSPRAESRWTAEECDQYRAEQAKLDATEKQARQDRYVQARHEYACTAAGTNPKRGITSLTEAKAYIRARTLHMLPKALDTIDAALADEKGKLADRATLALDYIKRANERSSMDAGRLAQVPPADAVELVMTAFANGDCDEAFAKTMLTILGQKVESAKVQSAMEAARKKVEKSNARQPVQQSQPAPSKSKMN
ncbi:hypothetical protein DPM33_23580 [Mesorhizobium hawassense]|uniref:Uncharacterized protein n=1 Tax=Mesorhizobium hawassense TaxID=1209954 RepID=A0A330HPB3_9HYPH|nr:hypothetical protein DPM33_23580 [Mesorhizobium hawassense]